MSGYWRSKQNLLDQMKEIGAVSFYIKSEGKIAFEEESPRGATLRTAARGAINNISSTFETTKIIFFIGQSYEQLVFGLRAMSDGMAEDYLNTNRSILWESVTEKLPSILHDITSMIEGDGPYQD